MDDRIGLVFSWDPRNRHWVKERGPEDAVPPPADPIDNEAVQTYYLDPQTGKWHSTILGLKARQISVDLKDAYRAAKVAGLAMIAQPVARRGVVAQPEPKSNKVPLMAGIAGVVVLIAAGAFAAQAMRPKDAEAIVPSVAAPTVATSVLPVASGPAATPDPAATEAPAPTGATQAPVRTTTPRTPTPTQPPPPQTVTFSTRLSNGTTVTYRGPSAVLQGAALDGVLSVQLAGGAGGTEPLTLYVGPLGQASTLTLFPDRNGNFVFSIKVSSPKGNVPISFSLGKNGSLYTLGTISVR